MSGNIFMHVSSGGRRRTRNRRGSLYIAVLLTTLLVSAMGLAAISSASLRMSSATDSNGWAEAQLLAQSAVEDAARQIQADPSWRTRFDQGVEYPIPARALGGGSYTWKLLDEDGALADDDSDSVRIVGIGKVGQTTAAESVRLLPTGQPLTSLETALHCQGGKFDESVHHQSVPEQQWQCGGHGVPGLDRGERGSNGHGYGNHQREQNSGSFRPENARKQRVGLLPR